MKTQIMSLLVCLTLGSMAFAQSSPSTSSSTPAANEIPAQPQEKSETEWKPDKAWAGDLRLRTRDTKSGLNDVRIREVLRARLAYRADVQQDMTAYLRLATSTSTVGDSAISANQTLGDSAAPGMQRRSFGLDLAYLEYRPMADAAVWAGKTPVVFYAPAKNQMVYDADLDFEGVSAKWSMQMGDLSTFANVGSSLVSENFAAPNDVPDMALLGAQAGVGYKMFGAWTADVGYYSWDNAQGRTGAQVNGVASAANSRFVGNSTDAGATLASKFNILQASLDWQYKLDELTAEAYYDFGRNGDANIGAASYETGVVLKYGKWSLGYANMMKEADSQLGAFTDSDANGGGTDVVGNRENLSYQATKSFGIALINYNGKRGISTASQTDFSETQLDLMGSF
jgi:hypothetical protein